MIHLNSTQVSGLLENAPPGAPVYLIGAGGCGVSGLGHLLLDLGFRVAGSDVVANQETRDLQARGARIHLGHSARQLKEAQPILAVYSSAVRLNNPELREAEQRQIPIVRRAVLLAALVGRQQGICVAGMHGKTTTTALLAFALENLSANPGYAVGAHVPQLERHARLSPQGASSFRSSQREEAPTSPPSATEKASLLALAAAQSLFVVEADESDGTLREFSPHHAIVLNVDEEHLDYYANLDAVCREFAHFGSQTREKLVFCADDSRLAELFARRPASVSHGFHALANYRAVLPRSRDDLSRPDPHFSTTFQVWHDGAKLGVFSIRLVGEKNVSNATAVIALLHELGYAAADIARAIADFKGAARRQQELFRDARFCVFDDYGHHPAEIEAVLAAFKGLGPRRLLVAFQPHRYTRTQALMNEFATCFKDADRLWITDIYSASEPEIPGVTSARLVEVIRAAQLKREVGADARPHPQEEGAVAPASVESEACSPAEKRDLVLTLPGRVGQGEGGSVALSEASQLRKVPVEYIPSFTDLRRTVRAAMLAGDVVVFFGAGDITKAAHELAAELREEFVTPDETLLAELTALLSANSVVKSAEPLAKRTTLRVGGKADFYVEPASEDDLAHVLKFCAKHQLKFTLLGRGSNLLIRDGGIRGVVICLCHPNFSRLEIVGDKIQAGAGVRLKAVSVEARRAGLTGLEFLEGIPGSVGGSMRMNAGAMGSWLFDVVERIRFMDYSGTVHERNASEVNVEYRGCPLFKSHIALGVVLKGVSVGKEAVAARMDQFSAKRWESQPKEPSAGCIFKNPKSIPAGRLIDELGLKGTRVGGAMVSDMHGNFIVNDGHATARDVLNLIAVIKDRARSARGIELETEVEILGEG
jgi:UDP-N-acetylenolpyruvoylglucosamine reductase